MSKATQEIVRRYHGRGPSAGQCGFVHVQEIKAPPSVVWSMVRRFDQPQSYNGFVRDCTVVSGSGGVGSVREVRLVSGLPGTVSTERLDALDDGRRLISFSVIGGDHRLANFSSTTTVHRRSCGGVEGTVVVESYVVDVPRGNTAEETRIFADTLISCKLSTLAQIAESIVASS